MITLYHKTMDFTLVFMINFSHNGHWTKVVLVKIDKSFFETNLIKFVLIDMTKMIMFEMVEMIKLLIDVVELINLLKIF